MTIRKNGRILAGGGGAVSADTNLSNLTAIGETHIGIKGYDATRTFKTNDVVSLVDGNGDTKLYKSLVDNNIGNPVSDTTKWAEVLLGSKIDNETIQSNDDKEIEVHGVLDAMDSKAMKFVECTVEQYDQWKADGELLPNTFYWKNDEVSTNVKSFRNVGDIFYTSRLDTYLNGAVECNGGEYYIADYIGEQNIGRLLQQGKLPYVSYADYATAISSKGSCRAFAYDGGTTFKVPTLNNVYIEAGTASSAGEFIDESLPNIKGAHDYFRLANEGVIEGSFTYSHSDVVGSPEPTFTNTNSRINFDASLSSSTYQNGSKVHPDSVKYRAMIQLATQTTDEAIATMTQMRAELDSLKALTQNMLYACCKGNKNSSAEINIKNQIVVACTGATSGKAFTIEIPATGYLMLQNTSKSFYLWGDPFVLTDITPSASVSNGTRRSSCGTLLKKGTFLPITFTGSGFDSNNIQIEFFNAVGVDLGIME